MKSPRNPGQALQLRTPEVLICDISLQTPTENMEMTVLGMFTTQSGWVDFPQVNKTFLRNYNSAADG